MHVKRTDNVPVLIDNRQSIDALLFHLVKRFGRQLIRPDGMAIDVHDFFHEGRIDINAFV